MNERIQAKEVVSVPYGVVRGASQAAAALKLHPDHLSTLGSHGGRKDRAQADSRPRAHSGLHKFYGHLSGLRSDQGPGDEAGVAVIR